MSYILFVFYSFISYSRRFTDFYFLRSEIIFGVYYLLSLAYFVPQRYLFYWNDGINVRRELSNMHRALQSYAVFSRPTIPKDGYYA